MRQLTKTQTLLMAVGALLMVVGVFLTVAAIGTIATPAMRALAAITFAFGAIIFAAMQLIQTYSGSNLTIRRLRRITVIGSICMVLSALLMLEQTFRIFMPLFSTSIETYSAYCHYVHNNWGVMLLIACILQLYATLRLSNEIKKES